MKAMLSLPKNVYGSAMRYWNNRGYRQWRKARAYVLRRLSMLEPADSLSLGVPIRASRGTLTPPPEAMRFWTDALVREDAPTPFRTALKPEREAHRFWSEALTKLRSEYETPVAPDDTAGARGAR